MKIFVIVQDGIPLEFFLDKIEAHEEATKYADGLDTVEVVAYLPVDYFK